MSHSAANNDASDEDIRMIDEDITEIANYNLACRTSQHIESTLATLRADIANNIKTMKLMEKKAELFDLQFIAQKVHLFSFMFSRYKLYIFEYVIIILYIM